MQLLNDSRTMVSPAESWGGSSSEKQLTLAPKEPLAKQWGLDKVIRWNLSREFAQACPFLIARGMSDTFLFIPHLYIEEGLVANMRGAVTASFPLYISKLVPEL